MQCISILLLLLLFYVTISRIIFHVEFSDLALPATGIASKVIQVLMLFQSMQGGSEMTLMQMELGKCFLEGEQERIEQEKLEKKQAEQVAAGIYHRPTSSLQDLRKGKHYCQYKLLKNIISLAGIHFQNSNVNLDCVLSAPQYVYQYTCIHCD